MTLRQEVALGAPLQVGPPLPHGLPKGATANRGAGSPQARGLRTSFLQGEDSWGPFNSSSGNRPS